MKMSKKDGIIVVITIEGVDYDKKIILSSFIDKVNNQKHLGYIDFNKLGDMNNDDIASSFWINSRHLVLWYKNNFNSEHNAYLLNYSDVHPECFKKPYKIIPTVSHNTKIYTFLKHEIKIYLEKIKEKNEKNCNNCV